jgi:hypothetical protein
VAAGHVESLETEMFAVEAPPGPPIVVSVEDGYLDDASGAAALTHDDMAVVTAGDETTYAVLSTYSGDGRLRVRTSRLDEDGGELRLDESRPLTTDEAAVSLSFDNPGLEPVLIGAACASGATDILVYDDAQQIVASTAGTSETYGPMPDRFVVGTWPQGTYHALFVDNGYGEELRCTVGARGLAEHTLAGPTERVLRLAPGSGFDAFLLQTSSESIAVVDGARAADASLQCGSNGRTTMPGGDGRLVAVISPDDECVVVLSSRFDEPVTGRARVRLVSLTTAAGAQP